MTETIKVFVGTDINGGCAECQMVFDYSLNKHSSLPVEIVWMKISNDPTSFWNGWNSKKWSTPFSGFRWGIPEYCNFQGKAIYCDDDQLWLKDPALLWNLPFEKDKFVQAKLHDHKNGMKEIRYCVMLWDCEKAKSYMVPTTRKVSEEYHSRMTNTITRSGGVQFFNSNWNNFDGEDEVIENINLLHYTDMSTNPGVKLAIKRLGDQSKHWYDGPVREHRRKDVIDVFNKYYQEALDAGYKVENYLPENIVEYSKQSQKDYISNNGFDVTQGQ